MGGKICGFGTLVGVRRNSSLATFVRGRSAPVKRAESTLVEGVRRFQMLRKWHEQYSRLTLLLYLAENMTIDSLKT